MPDLGRGLRILSFGCSEGFECLDLAKVFPDAAIFGCDLQGTVLAEASVRCFDTATIFECSASTLTSHGPFDAIIAHNVLCRFPQTRGLPSIDQIYPFHLFDEALQMLDRHLRLRGILSIYNSPYFFEQCSIAPRFLSVRQKNQHSNGWIEKCDKSGNRVTTGEFHYKGHSYNPVEWRDFRRCRRDGTNKGEWERSAAYTHTRLNTYTAGSLKQVLWQKANE